jgi:hypothetical protein
MLQGRITLRIWRREQPLYYVSQIRDELINKRLPFIKDIRGLLVQKSSAVTLDEKQITEKGLTINKLFFIIR